jgi:hypothetical protein
MLRGAPYFFMIRLRSFSAAALSRFEVTTASNTSPSWSTLAVKKQPSKLLLEKLDGARQGRLRHIAPLGCAREIELLGHREEITNLVHFHDNLTGMVDGHGSIGRTLLPKTLLSTFAVRLRNFGVCHALILDRVVQQCGNHDLRTSVSELCNQTRDFDQMVEVRLSFLALPLLHDRNDVIHSKATFG